MDNREIDKLIAEKVMGWRVFKTTEEWQKAGSPTGQKITVLDQTPKFEIPHYSTDIAAAWQVVEKMHSDGNHVQVWRNKNNNFWRASMRFEHGKWGKYFTQANTAPLAICLAALKAIGVTV